MKTTKKITALLLAVIMIMAMSVCIFAEQTPPGKIIIRNSVKDNVYKIYKVFDATINTTGNSIAYSTTKTLTAAAQNFFEKDSNNNITIKDAAKNSTTGELTADAIAAIATLVDTTATPDYTLTGNGDKKEINVAYGFYYIINSAVETSSVATITTANNSVTIIDKNTSLPYLPTDGHKAIMVEGKKETEVSYSVGEILDFKIEFNAVNFITKPDNNGVVESTKVVEYTIKDVADGFKIDKNSVKLMVGETKVTPSVTDNVYTIAWVDTDEAKTPLYQNDIKVVLTYKAEVTKAGTATNKATISYKDINGKVTDITPPGEDPDTKNINYTATIISKGQTSSSLVNVYDAKYSIKTGDTTIELVKVSDGVYKVADASDNNKVKIMESATGENTIKIKGLGDGDYKLVVEHNPEGYNKLAPDNSQLYIEIDGADESFDVIYTTGTTLPTTGSTGVTMFVVFGSAMIVVAGLFLVSNKRMSKEFN